MKKVFLVALALGLTVSCKPKAEEPIENVETYDAVILSDSSDYRNQDEPTESDVKVADKRYWSSSETKLPVGIVVNKDCANCRSENEKADLKDNYITIKRPNETLTIKKDIDEDLFLNVEVGDIIQ